MKKKLLALLMVGMMAFSANVYAEEGAEAATEDSLVMQGLDDNGITWTLVLSTTDPYACVALTPPGEETTYVYGEVAYADSSFVITDEEDGADYEFGYQDISETETILTYEPTGSEVQLTFVDQSVMDSNENYSIYAGLESDGTQLTMGFDWDNMEMAVNEKGTDGTEQLLEGTFEVAEDAQTVTFHSNEGVDLEFTVVDVEGVENQIDVTLGDETMRLSLVDMNALQQNYWEKTKHSINSHLNQEGVPTRDTFLLFITTDF